MLQEAQEALSFDRDLIEAYLLQTEALVEIGKTKTNDQSMIEEGIQSAFKAVELAEKRKDFSEV